MNRLPLLTRNCAREVLKVMQDLAEEGMTMVIVTQRNRFCRESSFAADLYRQRPDCGRWRSAGIDQEPAEPRACRNFCSTSLSPLPPFHPKGRHTRFLSFKIAPPQHLYLSFALFSHWRSQSAVDPVHPSCLAGRTCPRGNPYPALQTTTTTDSTTEPAPEPDIEQKAAYGALADVLDKRHLA